MSREATCVYRDEDARLRAGLQPPIGHGELRPVVGAAAASAGARAVAGRVFVSDCAMLPGADGNYQPNGSDAVYVIDKRVARPLAQGRELRNPNGLAADGAGGVWVVDGSGRVYRLDADGVMHDEARG